MTLDIEDSIQQADGQVWLEDVPPRVRERLNSALGELTGGDGPTGTEGGASNEDLVVPENDIRENTRMRPDTAFAKRDRQPTGRRGDVTTVGRPSVVDKKPTLLEVVR